MTSVVGYLDLFVERPPEGLTPDFKRQLAALRRNAHRLERLVEDMLDVSRIEIGQVALRRARCSLGDIVQEVVEEMRPLAEQRRQVLRVFLAPIPPILADDDKLHQVVTNLVANAIKHGRERGEVRLLVDALPYVGDLTHARLRVWDDGLGIPAEIRDRIFEPFHDVNSAKHHTSAGPDSAGLGLLIARGIVELHGGAISVESEEGRYTELSVVLPLAPDRR